MTAEMYRACSAKLSAIRIDYLIKSEGLGRWKMKRSRFKPCIITRRLDETAC